MAGKIYLAHIAEDGREQTVLEHLEGTAELCSRFAADFQAADLGRLTGMAHDIGKYSEAFQNRLLGDPQRVDHSTAGAWECQKLRLGYAAFAVAGHHGGLPNGGSRTDYWDSGTFCGRMNRAQEGKLEDYSPWKGEVTLPCVSGKRFSDGAEAMFFTRMLYSCLVDADFLDTETFMAGNGRKSEKTDMGMLWERFDKRTKGWQNPKGELNCKRQEILQSCILAGEKEKTGLFSLTVPTGGGKTAASLGFALAHGKTWGMKRIIYVIPYTSIIEQTAAKFREFLGSEQVLEHHSGVLYDLEGEATPETIRMAKATENWDMPVIVTTAVQFFESLFSNRGSKCRKLHNLSQSVIIFDEAQMLPVPYLRPCVWAITQLVKNYGASAVLCTATQPALENMIGEFLPGVPVRELCPKILSGWDGFRRVGFVHGGSLSWEALAEQMNACPQVLCIVNARKSAQTLYSLLDKEGSFHLSTLMYPEHRKRKLKEIRFRLENNLPCRVVATSLIEAGVDVDFPTVYREEAGLDSIIQAGGRCNREGKRPLKESVVTVFHSEAKDIPMLKTASGIARMVMAQNPDFASVEAIHRYFSMLMTMKGETLDKQGILKGMSGGWGPLAFEDVASAVHLIDSQTKTVYIPLGEGEDICKRLLDGDRNRNLFRAAGRYGVNVYPQHFAALDRAGALVQVEDGTAILLNPEKSYTEETGLNMEPEASALLML